MPFLVTNNPHPSQSIRSRAKPAPRSSAHFHGPLLPAGKKTAQPSSCALGSYEGGRASLLTHTHHSTPCIRSRAQPPRLRAIQRSHFAYLAKMTAQPTPSAAKGWGHKGRRTRLFARTNSPFIARASGRGAARRLHAPTFGSAAEACFACLAKNDCQRAHQSVPTRIIRGDAKSHFQRKFPVGARGVLAPLAGCAQRSRTCQAYLA